MITYTVGTKNELDCYRSRASAPVVVLECSVTVADRDAGARTVPAALAGLTNPDATHIGFCTGCSTSSGEDAAYDGNADKHRYVPLESQNGYVVLTSRQVADAWAREHAAGCSLHQSQPTAA